MSDSTEEFNKIQDVPNRTGTSQHRQPVSWMASASLGFGIIGLVAGWLIFGVPSWVAVWLAVATLRDKDHGGRLMAHLGLILGLMGTVVGIVVLVAVIFG